MITGSEMFNMSSCIPFGYKSKWLYGSDATFKKSGNKEGLKCICKSGSVLVNGKCLKCPTKNNWKRARKLLVDRGNILERAILHGDWSTNDKNPKTWGWSNNNGVAQMLVKFKWSRDTIKKMIEAENAGCTKH